MYMFILRQKLPFFVVRPPVKVCWDTYRGNRIATSFKGVEYLATLTGGRALG